MCNPSEVEIKSVRICVQNLIYYRYAISREHFGFLLSFLFRPFLFLYEKKRGLTLQYEEPRIKLTVFACAQLSVTVTQNSGNWNAI